MTTLERPPRQSSSCQLLTPHLWRLTLHQSLRLLLKLCRKARRFLPFNSQNARRNLLRPRLQTMLLNELVMIRALLNQLFRIRLPLRRRKVLGNVIIQRMCPWTSPQQMMKNQRHQEGQMKTPWKAKTLFQEYLRLHLSQGTFRDPRESAQFLSPLQQQGRRATIDGSTLR